MRRLFAIVFPFAAFIAATYLLGHVAPQPWGTIALIFGFLVVMGVQQKRDREGKTPRDPYIPRLSMGVGFGHDAVMLPPDTGGTSEKKQPSLKEYAATHPWRFLIGVVIMVALLTMGRVVDHGGFLWLRGW